jgi:hypothetical protein
MPFIARIHSAILQFGPGFTDPPRPIPVCFGKRGGAECDHAEHTEKPEWGQSYGWVPPFHAGLIGILAQNLDGSRGGHRE